MVICIRFVHKMQAEFLFIRFWCFNSGRLPAKLILTQKSTVQASPVATQKEMKRPLEITPRHFSLSCKMIEINSRN